MVAWFIPYLVAGAAAAWDKWGAKKNVATEVAPEGSPYYDLQQYLKTGVRPGGGGGGSSSTSSSSSRQNIDIKTSPFFTPEFQNLGTMLRQRAENRLKQGSALPPGFEANGVSAINRANEGGQQAVLNRLISMGLSQSPGPSANALAGFERDRVGQIANFQTQLPLMERGMANEDMALVQQILSAMGIGQHQKGTTTTNSSSQSQSGGGGGGGGFDPQAMMAALAQRNAGNMGDGGSELMGTLFQLFGQWAAQQSGKKTPAGSPGGGGFGPAGPPPAGGGGYG